MTAYNVYDFFLIFGSPYLFLLITLTGFLLLNKNLFYQAACIAAFSVVVNVALKGTFKIPLSFYKAQLTYAFPSGHMQFETVFYGWLALYFHSWWLYCCVALMFFGSAAAMEYFHYHDTYDLVGGFIVGLILIGLYHFSLKKFRNILPWVALILATLVMYYSHFMYETIPNHSWKAYEILIGLIVIERIYNHKKQIRGLFVKKARNRP